MMQARSLVEHPAVHPSGVYFGMPDTEYHAAFALSSHGIGNLHMSSLDFWARCPALNPDYKDEDTEARQIGRAYHARIVEGPEVFAAAFAQELDPAQHPDALRTIPELLAALQVHLEPKKSLRKGELIAALRRVEPGAQIWDVMLAEHLARHHGKTFLKPWL